MAAETTRPSGPVFTCNGVPFDWADRPNAARNTLRRVLTSFRVMGIKRLSLCLRKRLVTGLTRHHRATRDRFRDGNTATLRD